MWIESMCLLFGNALLYIRYTVMCIFIPCSKVVVVFVGFTEKKKRGNKFLAVVAPTGIEPVFHA